jgi:hypothetical protein
MRHNSHRKLRQARLVLRIAGRLVDPQAGQPMAFLVPAAQLLKVRRNYRRRQRLVVAELRMLGKVYSF